MKKRTDWRNLDSLLPLALFILMILSAIMTFPSCGERGPSPVPSPSPSASPSPVACAAPSSCPPLFRWTVGVHHWMDGEARLVEGPMVGGVALMDSTPRFGADHLPCNNEDHRACAASCDQDLWRKCEDPRGASWHVEGPAHLINVQQPGPLTGFQSRISLDSPGVVTVVGCPPADLRDAEGLPVGILEGEGCGAFSFRIP